MPDESRAEVKAEVESYLSSIKSNTEAVTDWRVSEAMKELTDQMADQVKGTVGTKSAADYAKDALVTFEMMFPGITPDSIHFKKDDKGRIYEAVISSSP
jgi:hypothetical protein